MILTLTPNPAWDVTYRVDRYRPGHSHRVADPHGQAGGKGVNAASVLTLMGHPALVVAPVGGPLGAAFAADLMARGVAAELVPGAPLRTSVAIHDEDGATLFNEVGHPQPEAAWAALLDAVRARTDADALVVSGSLPPGAPDDLLAQFVRTGQDLGMPVVLDTRGPALRVALAAQPTLVTSNAREAAENTGGLEPEAAVRALLATGATNAVVTNGSNGLIMALAGGELVRARLREPLVGNPTGAGDAVTAAVAAALAAASTVDWSEALRDAVAWGAAAVLAPFAGGLQVGDVERLRSMVVVESG